MTGPYFRGYLITHIQDCLADPTKIRVIAEAQGGVGEMLPYLNAILPRASYSHGANALTLKRGHRLITLYPQVAIIVKADDEEDALAILAWFSDLIEATATRKDTIVPNFERRRAVGFLDVYRLLPGGNCKVCGHPTCLAFAVALLDGRGRLQQCRELSDAQRARLADLLPDA
jgi:ArsR family metal-binding transcriptional regulator